MLQLDACSTLEILTSKSLNSAVPVTLAVYRACQHIRIDYRCMIQIIHLYAESNAAFRRGLTETIEKKKWNHIAVWLRQDLQDLPSLVTAEWIEEKENMKAVLEVLKSEWFDTSTAPEEPLGWSPKPAIVSYNESVKKNKEKAKKEFAEVVAKKAAALLAATAEEESLLAQAAVPLNR